MFCVRPETLEKCKSGFYDGVRFGRARRLRPSEKRLWLRRNGVFILLKPRFQTAAFVFCGANVRRYAKNACVAFGRHTLRRGRHGRPSEKRVLAAPKLRFQTDSGADVGCVAQRRRTRSLFCKDGRTVQIPQPRAWLVPRTLPWSRFFVFQTASMIFLAASAPQ